LKDPSIFNNSSNTQDSGNILSQNSRLEGIADTTSQQADSLISLLTSAVSSQPALLFQTKPHVKIKYNILRNTPHSI